MAPAIQRNVEVYHGKRIPLESKWQLIIGRPTIGSYKAKFSITALAVKTDSDKIFIAEIVLVIGASLRHILGELGALHCVTLNLRLNTT